MLQTLKAPSADAPKIDAWFHPKFEGLFQPKRYKVYYGGRGGLKCLALGTEVLMYDGTLRKVEDVKVGNLVMGPDSTPRKVLDVYTGRDELFEVNQIGAESYIVTGEHLLSLRKDPKCKFERGEIYRYDNNGEPIYRRPFGRYPYVPEIFNIAVYDFIDETKKFKSRFKGYKAGLIEFPQTNVPLPIDPYFLGAWLGDGTARELNITNMDSEVIEYCRQIAERIGLGFTLYKPENNRAYTIRLPKLKGKTNPLWRAFVDLDLPNNKHIPHRYLVAPEEDRLELLAGLIDTDGSLKQGRATYTITSSNEILAKQIKRLADHLGFRTGIHRVKTYRKDSLHILIRGDVWRIPCKITRKKISQEDASQNKFNQYEIDVKPLGEGDFAGFTCDGDQLFCLADGTVTHNTWSIARALVLLGAQRPLRILCAREFQKSIKESVHQSLEEQIKRMGLEDYYEIQRDTIRGRPSTSAEGTEFFFIGLHLNAQSIKSYEAVDICWIEEAANVSESSWKYVTPTIRKPNGGPFGQGAEIWISFNPELDTDATWKRFVKRLRDNALVMKTTYRDNPYLSDEYLQDILSDKEEDFDNYLHVWEGNTRQVLEGAVYADEIRAAIGATPTRFTRVPYDPSHPVNIVADLGYSDHTSLWFVQRVGFEWHFIDFYENNLKKWDFYLAEIAKKPYLYATLWLPHDATAKQLGSKMTIEEQAREKFPNLVRIVPKVSIKDKVNAARTVFPLCYFDEEKCEEGIQHLKRYTYEVKLNPDMTKSYSQKPLHDEHSDAASAFEYFAVSSGIATRSKEGIKDRLDKALKMGKFRELRSSDANSGPRWMR